MNFFKILCLITSALFLFLFFQLLISPESFVKGMGLQPSVSTAVLARRASMFMLGISVLLFSLRNLRASKARQFISLSTGITLAGLACTGIYEHFMGTVNSSIFIAIIIESVLGLSFLIIFLKDNEIENHKMVL